MAYKPLTGTVKPTTIPPEEKEPKSSVLESLQNQHTVIPFKPRENLLSTPNDGDSFPHRMVDLTANKSCPSTTYKELTPGTISIGDKVVRRIVTQRNHIGIVESLYYHRVNGEERLKDVWVSFSGRPSTPYELSDLLGIKVQ